MTTAQVRESLMVLARIPWSRKATTWEAEAISDRLALEAAGYLPVFDQRSWVGPMRLFKEERPDLHVVRVTYVAGGLTRFFLVRTEGSNYARYVACLPAWWEPTPGLVPEPEPSSDPLNA